MGDHPSPCPDDDRLVALALGELTGRERADAVAHLPECHTCRDKVAEIIDTSERLLVVAPDGEPPAGFDAAVLERLRSADVTVRRRPGVPLLAFVAGIVVAVVVATAVVLVASRSAELASATMVSPAGYEVGTAWTYGGDPAWVLVAVPEWTIWEGAEDPPDEYRLVVELDGGSVATLGIVTFNEADGSWGTTTAIDTSRIRRAAIVDEAGRVWCSATF